MKMLKLQDSVLAVDKSMVRKAGGMDTQWKR